MSCRGAILVVDDDADNREALAAMLEKRGCTVVTARDGLEALAELSRQTCVCLVLLDMNMPRLDGEGFACAVRGGCCGSDVPIVSMSAGDDRLSVAGFRHLAKPFAASALDTVVAAVCAERQG